MLSQWARFGPAWERWIHSVGNFGLRSALDVYGRVRMFRSSAMTSVRLKSLDRRFHYRGFADFNALSHLMTVGYRISDDAAATKIRWIVDAGANIGDETLRFHAFHPEATIVALEPEPSNYALLSQNAADIPQVHCLREGLWSNSNWLRVVPGPDHLSHQVQEVAEGTSGALRASSIGDLMQRFGMDRIDILKMDIEGSEGPIFAAEDVSWLEHVRCLIFELPDNDFPCATQIIYRALDRAGVRMKSCVHGECLILTRDGEGLKFLRTASLEK